MERPLRLVTAVVQRKLGKKVIDAALAAGATGATFFYGQGAGVRERLGFWGRLIEAEKQVVLIVVPADDVKRVLEAIARSGGLGQTGQGFAYVQEVTDVVGFLPATSMTPGS